MRKIIFILLLAFATAAAAQDYLVNRSDGGPFSIQISGIALNEGSSLRRESIILNDPNCPIQISAHNSSFGYESRSFRISANTSLAISQSANAVNVRTAQFDVFGQHMSNLSNTEVVDMLPGDERISATWRASDNDPSELLTTVTYVAIVRLSDGSIWRYDRTKLLNAIDSLNLDNDIGNED